MSVYQAKAILRGHREIVHMNNDDFLFLPRDVGLLATNDM